MNINTTLYICYYLTYIRKKAKYKSQLISLFFLILTQISEDDIFYFLIILKLFIVSKT